MSDFTHRGGISLAGVLRRALTALLSVCACALLVAQASAAHGPTTPFAAAICDYDPAATNAHGALASSPRASVPQAARGLANATRRCDCARPPNLIAAKGGTEVVQRAMSRAELEATLETGLVRGGRSGTHYVSDAVNANAKRARQRLALPQTPEVRVDLEVPKGAFGPPTRVRRNFGMPGGGFERTATGPVRCRVVGVRGYC